MPITERETTPPVLAISAGDVLQMTFPGATNLNGVHRVGPAGAITMPTIGQVHAAGKTVSELEAELEQLYARDLNKNDVVITLTGSANVVYVTGSVLSPGRVLMDRPLTALEAILESGGFTPDANMSRVTITRYIGAENYTWVLDLTPLREGGPVPRFYLWPRDALYVPKKMQWF